MADTSAAADPDQGEEEGSAYVPRKRIEDAELDMTPMIDCVFLLLIYFLVASRPDPQTAVTLPPAHYGMAVSAKRAVILTIAEPQGSGLGLVYLSDGKQGTPVEGNEDQQTEEIARYIEETLQDRAEIEAVIVKADSNVRHKDVARVAQAVAQAAENRGRSLIADDSADAAESQGSASLLRLHLAVAEEKE